MTDSTAAIASGNAALSALYSLQVAAMKQGDLASQKALKDDIDDLTYKLTQLNAVQINADQTQIDALGKSLDALTQQANASLAKLSNLTAVLQTAVNVAKLIDTVLQTATAA